MSLGLCEVTGSQEQGAGGLVLGEIGQGVALRPLLLQLATGPSPGSLGTQTWPFCLAPFTFTKKRTVGVERSSAVLYVIVLTEQGPTQGKVRSGCCSYRGLCTPFCTPCPHL